MNVNGARFQLLLGRGDWGRCVVDGASLASWWSGGNGATDAAAIPGWDERRQELTLRARRLTLPATATESPLTLEARRAAAADRYGNVYRVSDDRAALLVASAEGGRETTFWPAEPSDCAPARERARLAFAPVASATPPSDRYLALATTDDDYLVVAFARDSARGLLTFDLVGGGMPVETRWPAPVPFEPWAMCQRTGGGVWVLDRVHRRLWELDRALAAVPAGQAPLMIEPPEIDDFQPGTGPRRIRAMVEFPAGADLAAMAVPCIDPIAIVERAPATVLVLDAGDESTLPRIVRLRRDGDRWAAAASGGLPLPGAVQDCMLGAAPRFSGESVDDQLFVTTAVGNQAHVFTVVDSRDAVALYPAPELFPLRRYAGRALVRVRGGVRYDSGITVPAWTGVIEQPRPSFEGSATFLSPVFDSGDVDTTWDKLVLDACIPADTAVEIESCAGDECYGIGGDAASPAMPPQVIGAWASEPTPILRPDGPELVWLRGDAARQTRRASGTGSWELLFQRAQGRYLQLRVTLRSASGTGTPRLRALRVWSPRFSYPDRFLPAVYREDPAPGAFLERWLANFESTFTQMEDRMANVRWLFDARTAPTDAMDWLAGWFDVALDPAWDERRHRLFVERAMDFFRWRGTMHGLRLALSLGLDPCFDASLFDDPGNSEDGPRRIRLVEAYQTRVTTPTASGQPPAVADTPREIVRGIQWTPDEGNAGLADRYARWLGRAPSTAELLTPVSLVPPDDAASAATWSSFFQSVLGFIPTDGAADRAAWQRYLRLSYDTLAELQAAHGVAYASFDVVPMPADQPTNATIAEDWAAFCALPDVTRARSRWQQYLARRYRRIEKLQSAHGTRWPDFGVVALPDHLPERAAAQTDWLQFERQLMPMHGTAHRFTVLLPMESVTADAAESEARLGLARRLVELEKPAHTTFDVRYYWAFNVIGEARLELDTQIGAGSRAPELIPDAVVGRAYLGASFVGGAPRLRGGDRLSIDC